jgi:hypothetical protein
MFEHRFFLALTVVLVLLPELMGAQQTNGQTNNESNNQYEDEFSALAMAAATEADASANGIEMDSESRTGAYMAARQKLRELREEEAEEAEEDAEDAYDNEHEMTYSHQENEVDSDTVDVSNEKQNPFSIMGKRKSHTLQTEEEGDVSGEEVVEEEEPEGFVLHSPLLGTRVLPANATAFDLFRAQVEMDFGMVMKMVPSSVKSTFANMVGDQIWQYNGLYRLLVMGAGSPLMKTVGGGCTVVGKSLQLIGEGFEYIGQKIRAFEDRLTKSLLDQKEIEPPSISVKLDPDAPGTDEAAYLESESLHDENMASSSAQMEDDDSDSEYLFGEMDMDYVDPNEPEWDHAHTDSPGDARHEGSDSHEYTRQTSDDDVDLAEEYARTHYGVEGSDEEIIEI